MEGRERTVPLDRRVTERILEGGQRRRLGRWATESIWKGEKARRGVNPWLYDW